MPLHLLGKKSWNVYNQDNISRVRQDEAKAQAREEAEEQRQQEEDAQRRIALLRGEEPPPLQPTTSVKEDDWRNKTQDDTYAQRDRKRKRRHGEDDTDRDMRYAPKDGDRVATQVLVKGREKDAPLQDHAGNIQLIPAPDEVSIRKAEKNAEVEAEKAKKRKREEDQVTMRFSNAAGFQNGMQKPWYSTATQSTGTDMVEAEGKDVWGNPDPRKKEREQSRVVSSDPFAAMQQAQRQLKQSEHDRDSWEKKQRAEIEALKKEQRRERRRDVNEDSLDGFSLDAPEEKGRERRSDCDRHRRRHHHRHRSRSRDREGHRRRSRSRDRSSRVHHSERDRDRDRGKGRDRRRHREKT